MLKYHQPMKKTLAQIHEDVPADHYDRGIENNLFQKYWHNKRISKIQKAIFETDGKILDIGCHAGLLTNVVYKRNPKSVIYGIDISPSAIKLAAKRIKKGHFIVADAHKLPFKNNFFDGLVCFEMLEHVEQPEIVISEMFRVLKKKSYSLILVPTDNLLFKVVWFLWNLRFKHWSHAHVQSFQKDSLEQLFRKIGFNVIRSDTFNLGMLKQVTVQKV